MLRRIATLTAMLLIALLLAPMRPVWARGGGHSGGYHGGSVHVGGYFRSNGTYVAPYTRSAPHSDSSPLYSPPSYAPSPSSAAPVTPAPSLSASPSSVERDSHGRIKRSAAARMTFLHSRGLTHTPSGCQVDHVIPLAKGGADNPSNMQLLCGEALRAKEQTELK